VTDPEVVSWVATVDADACRGPRKNYTKKEDERKKERETRRLAVVNEWEKVHPDKAYKQQRSDGNSKDVMSIEE